jgi:hypothetical protein
MMETIEKKTFDFLSILTAVIVLLFVGSSVWALTSKNIEWQDFLAAVGPMASMLLGYWVRGEK